VKRGGCGQMGRIQQVWHLHGGTEDSHDITWVSIAGLPAEIRTVQSAITKPLRYHYLEFLGLE
jgi:hypothetical protein